jgi:transcription termination factor Rho
MSVLRRKDLEASPLADLHAIASELGLEGYRRLKRDDLLDAILAAQEADEDSDEGDAEVDTIETEEELLERGEDAPAAEEDEEEPADQDKERLETAPLEEEELEAVEDEEAPVEDDGGRDDEGDVRSGVLDILPNGSGFMRVEPFTHSREDVYVSAAQIRRCELRSGDELSGPVRPPRRSERYPSLVRVESVNGGDPEPPADRPRFEDLTPRFPTQRLAASEPFGSAPFGRGSRVIIGGGPGVGATTLLREAAAILAEHHPDIELTVVLAGVRPEEVIEWREVLGAPVVGGGFDRSIDEQAQIAELAVERAKRVAETGGDAAVVIDSLSALPAASARRVLGGARNTEEAGSVTLLATGGEADEPRRAATTRLVLERGIAGGPPRVIDAASGTVRVELLP